MQYIPQASLKCYTVTRFTQEPTGFSLWLWSMHSLKATKHLSSFFRTFISVFWLVLALLLTCSKVIPCCCRNPPGRCLQPPETHWPSLQQLFIYLQADVQQSQPQSSHLSHSGTIHRASIQTVTLAIPIWCSYLRANHIVH